MCIVLLEVLWFRESDLYYPFLNNPLTCVCVFCVCVWLVQSLTFMNILKPVLSRSVRPPDMCSMSGHSGLSGWKISSRTCLRNGRYVAWRTHRNTEEHRGTGPVKTYSTNITSYQPLCALSYFVLVSYAIVTTKWRASHI